MKKIIAFMLVAMMMKLPVSAHQKREELPASSPYSIEYCFDQWNSEEKKFLFLKCEEYELNPYIMAAVIYNESNFVPGLVHVNTNGTKDYGYGQINEVCFPFLQTKMGISSMEELLDNYKNIEAMCVIMDYHKDATGCDSCALLRYQVGEGTYSKMVKSGKELTTETHSRVYKLFTKIKHKSVI